MVEFNPKKKGHRASLPKLDHQLTSLCGYACPTIQAIILDCETLYFQNVYVYIIYTLEFELMITVFRRKRKQCPLTMDPRRVHHGS